MNNPIRGGKTDKLSASLPEIMRDKGWERKLDQHRVFIDWQSLVDETTAAHSRPLKVVKDVLWLEVENSSWMQQLQYQKFFLLQTLNEYLKISRFSDIRFVVEEKKKEAVVKKEKSIRFVPPSTADVERFKKQISFIEDEQIRESLMRLWYLSQACRKDEG
jgi:hypothetical protein